MINDDGSQLSVKAKPFQSKTPDEQTDYEDTIKFTLVDERDQTSSLFTMSSQGEVETLQSMDYEGSTAHQFVLTLKAVEESTQLSSTTQVGIMSHFSRYKRVAKSSLTVLYTCTIWPRIIAA